MKKLVLLGALVASAFFVKAQTAGKIFVGDSQGKSFKFGSEKSSNVVLEAVKAYNANNSAAETALWSDEMIKKYAEANQKGHAEYQSVVNKPMAILPLYAEGQKTEVVLLQSTEERIFKNGSKQNLNLFELFQVDKSGKIAGFTQYYSIPKTNEYGKTYGGKFIAEKAGSEVDGRPFEFSNRGEVEAIENFAKAYNAMDVKGVEAILADVLTIEDFEGNKSKFTKDMIPALFAEFKSLEWKPTFILPFKLKDTDPVSGIMVYSTEKRVLKDGKVWEKDIVELFRFNLAGKIDGLTQFSREKTKK
jgi:hypothetical protein